MAKSKKYEAPIVVQTTNEPSFTREYLIEIRDHLNSKTSTEFGRNRINEFNYLHFGELIQGYCDQACKARTQKRLDKCFQELNEYEQNKK